MKVELSVQAETLDAAPRTRRRVLLMYFIVALQSLFVMVMLIAVEYYLQCVVQYATSGIMIFPGETIQVQVSGKMKRTPCIEEFSFRGLHKKILTVKDRRPVGVLQDTRRTLSSVRANSN